MNPKVDFFFKKESKWQQEFERLRMIILNCNLNEELKWGVPCYTCQRSNIVLIHGFKEYCAILFIKGALLQDNNKILIQQTENVQSARQIRFTDLNQIIGLEPVLKTYIYEAIKLEKAGTKVVLNQKPESVPEEFHHKLKSHPGLKKAFESLTPGRRRAYLLFFSAAKQSKTRESRIEKCIPLILEGKGLND